MKTLYLANPYGFAPTWKDKLLPELITRISALGIEVWEPFTRNNQVDYTVSGWARNIGQADVSDVTNADGIFAVCNMNPPDEGVMVELGIAIALHKPTFIFRDDFRHCCDSEEYPLNLMTFTGIPDGHNWRDYYYTSIEELWDENKALVKFAKGLL